MDERARGRDKGRVRGIRGLLLWCQSVGTPVLIVCYSHACTLLMPTTTTLSVWFFVGCLKVMGNV